ncbi:MAG: NAD(P) transhydrogenase subunit alpha [Planctomycetales bacterium]|nr:NAD(P) transhydrogenase subunit alpha [Planctomycetales bacterium]
MLIAAVKETFPGERRVALAPSVVPALMKRGASVAIETGAGAAAGFPDEQYVAKGARIVHSRREAFELADIVVGVRLLGANGQAGESDLADARSGQIVMGMCDPLSAFESFRAAADKNVSVFALELIPRITRAQSMDVLSSMATVAGYRAVLLGASALPKMFPMITYAAGMLRPARVFIIGAGVAGLRAIATAKALGAAVQGHDIRPTSREEVQSVGAKFVELPLEGDTQDAGGYAKKLTDEDYERQRQVIAGVCRESDLVITTAAIPGRRSPLLVTAEAVAGMTPGSVIIDLAAERGGNCALTKADEQVVAHGVTILGPTNLSSDAPAHASEMYANNVVKFLANMTDKDGKLKVDATDEIIADTLVTMGGEIVNDRIRKLLGLEPLQRKGDFAAVAPSDANAPIPFDSDHAEGSGKSPS